MVIQPPDLIEDEEEEEEKQDDKPYREIENDPIDPDEFVEDTDVANDPSTLEEDDEVVASRDDEGNLHTGFKDEGSDSGVTNSNVDTDSAVVLEPTENDGFEQADDQTIPNTDTSGSDADAPALIESANESADRSTSAGSGSESGSGSAQDSNQSGIGPAVQPPDWSPDSGGDSGLDTQTMVLIAAVGLGGLGLAFVVGGGD